MMPKGVEHWVEKLGSAINRLVRIPMMPKGVEHFHRYTENDLAGVRIPMMPKGVEHLDLLQRHCLYVDEVRIPMMPKGVEHDIRLLSSNCQPKSENSDDAERR